MEDDELPELSFPHLKRLNPLKAKPEGRGDKKKKKKKKKFYFFRK
jgi:hypothetical protein